MTEFFRPPKEGGSFRILDGWKGPYYAHLPVNRTSGVVCAGETCPICRIAETQSTKRFCWRHRKFDFWRKRICEGCYAEHPLHSKPMTLTEVHG